MSTKAANDASFATVRSIVLPGGAAAQRDILTFITISGMGSVVLLNALAHVTLRAELANFQLSHNLNIDIVYGYQSVFCHRLLCKISCDFCSP